MTARSSSDKRTMNFLFMGNLLVVGSFPENYKITNPNSWA
jgi:hypothetical protein